MITRERAVALAEEALLHEHRSSAYAEGPLPAEVVTGVKAHEFGWLVTVRSRAWVETGDSRHAIVGGGPILVDGEGGGVFMIPAVVLRLDTWRDEYRRRVRGQVPDDPHAALRAQVAGVLASHGRLAAIRALRRELPALDLRQAVAFVSALQRGEESGQDLALPPPPEPASVEQFIRLL
ncbi:YrhB domain-containing protein [Streptomyces zhihengii]|uniref:Immunity protein 35 domain-containing protein n=1 Tax=Streptomyces zhihengii TaxID=1818004 RepID=A0ABS2UHV9_9ACTN|nr:YrhB domain-containing protein [Streptomyces zhihengii]MBM9617229.1 hypothetical protein [Streptomyces zhihengii]